MKKLLYTFLAVSIIFSACKKEDEEPNNSGNNNTGNNSSGTIADVVGVWNYVGHYDALGNLYDDWTTVQENCVAQSNLILQSDGNAINQWYYLQYENSGPCIYENMVFSFEYINSTTLNFLTPNCSGTSNTSVATIINNTQLSGPTCSDGVLDGGYILYEKQ
tara:strand:+ start:140 stop:625 length:486 start_codon:yes stop_codon:yes gene_type:complete